MPESTPTLVIDNVVAERNLARLADYAAAHRLNVRPHTKTHKSLRLARRQIELGATGVAVAKLGEAQVMAQASADLLVAYPAFDDFRRRGLAELAKRVMVRVALDSRDGVAALSDAAAAAGSTIGVLVDLDVGFHRTGLQSVDAVVEMARQVSRMPSLRFDGLFCYPGHVRSPADRQAKELAQVADRLEEACMALEAVGLPPPIVSGGSTPTAFQSHLVPRLTEIRPGTYIFNDMNTVLGGFCSLDDCAARIVCTVVSTAVPGKVVIDAGSKTLTSDRNMINPDAGHGHVLEHPEAKIVRLSEEHGEIDITRCDPPPRLGERVSVIPNHICPCVNLVDQAWLQTGADSLEPLRINARGKPS